MKNYNPNKIREKRNKLKLTQEQLAERTGISRAHLADIERGKKIPKANVLAKIANALKVRVSYFFN